MMSKLVPVTVTGVCPLKEKHNLYQSEKDSSDCLTDVVNKITHVNVAEMLYVSYDTELEIWLHFKFW